MFVYVTAGPANPNPPAPAPVNPLTARWRFRSSTIALRDCVAAEMFKGLEGPDEYAGVAAPSEVAPVAGRGVEAPELFCVASTEASLRWDSEMICLVFLLRRVEGFQLGLRKGFGV